MHITLEFGKEYQEYSVGDIAYIDEDITLDCKKTISNFPIAYKTYGTLNENKSNVIVIHHPITGDQYVAEKHPITQKEGWWSNMVGPNLSIDTNKYFVISANVIGSCMGSYGPKTIDTKTNQPYGLKFPVITITDMVRAYRALLKYLDINKIHSVVGGSMGGALALEWCRLYGDITHNAIVIAATGRYSSQNIAFNQVGKQAIMSDNDWCDGEYFKYRKFPHHGLGIARMGAHITYLSNQAIEKKFGRNFQKIDSPSFTFESDFSIQSYLTYQAQSFTKRFDPNSYLYLTRALDYFNLYDQDLVPMNQTQFCLISFSSDWLFPPSEMVDLAEKLINVNASVSYINIESDKGHDAFLLKNLELENSVASFLAGRKV